jgi:hypothetical protein
MDGLITVAKLREIFEITSKIPDTRFNRALTAAGRRMRQWVGDAAYNDALLDPPADATRKADLEYAEAHLVMHFAVLGINTALRQTGIVQTEKVDDNTTVTYLSPAQIAVLQQEFLDHAEMLAGPYLVNTGSEPPPEIVDDSESTEGATVLV